MRRALTALLLGLLLPAAAAAEGKTIAQPPDNPYAALAEGPGVQLTRNQCGMCHSTDYVVMQPRGDAKQWEGVVTKMIKVYGAPLSPEDAAAIVTYLGEHYGK